MLAQKLILSYGTRIVVQIIQIGASIIVARIAGPTVLGTVAFGLAFVSVLTFLSDLGIGTAHIKLVSEGQDLGKCISTFSRLKAGLTLFFALAVLGVYLAQKYIFHVQFESPAHEYVILILLATVTIDQLLFIPKTTFMAKTEQAKTDIPDFIRTGTHQIFRIIIVFLGYKAVALALGNLLAAILIVPFVLYLFKDYPRDGFDKQLAYKYLKISLPVLIIGMSTNVLSFFDRLVLQYFTNSEQVGYYSAGHRIGGFIFLLASRVGLLFFPLFSAAASRGDFEYIKTKIDKFERFSFVYVMPPVIFFSLYSDVIVKFLLGDQYLSSIPVMALLNIAMFFVVLNIPYGNVLTGMGFFNLAAILNLMNLFFAIGLMLVLPNPKVFNLGARGAAIAVLASNAFIGILYRLYAKRKAPILDLNKAVKFLAYGTVNFFGFYMIYQHFFFNRTDVFSKLAFIPIYFFVTYLLLILLGLMKKEDLKNIQILLNFKKLGEYIKGEIAERERNGR